jgi:hypothetical protein
MRSNRAVRAALDREDRARAELLDSPNDKLDSGVQQSHPTFGLPANSLLE